MSRLAAPPAHDPPDAQLAADAARRDPARLPAAQAAFRALYDRHARLLVAFLAARVPSSDVDDLAQTVWARVWQGLPTQFDGGHFRGWLYQIARNLAIDHARRKRADAADVGDERADDRAAAPDAALADREERVRLERCLKKLAADHRAVVTGRLGGEDYDVISGRLGIPAARAHKLFFEAKALLQDCVTRGDR